jgi:hypothetical protein
VDKVTLGDVLPGTRFPPVGRPVIRYSVPFRCSIAVKSLHVTTAPALAAGLLLPGGVKFSSVMSLNVSDLTVLRTLQHVSVCLLLTQKQEIQVVIFSIRSL